MKISLSFHRINFSAAYTLHCIGSICAFLYCSIKNLNIYECFFFTNVCFGGIVFIAALKIRWRKEPATKLCPGCQQYEIPKEEEYCPNCDNMNFEGFKPEDFYHAEFKK